MASEDRKSKINKLILLIFPLLFSCQTMPKMPEIRQDAASLPLSGGASVYIIADVKKARPIIDLLPIEELNDRQAKQMLDRTDFFAAALFPRESGKRFQIAAFGNYPGSQANFALSINKGWQRQRSQAGGSYWYSQSNGLSMAVSPRQAAAASSANNEPFDPFAYAPGVEIPEGFNEFRKMAEGSAPLSLWLENPAPSISRVLGGAGVPLRFPIKGLFINLLPIQENRHEAVIRLGFENASHARGMAAVLSLAAGLLPSDPNSIIASILFANPPILNGSNIDIKSAALSEAGIIQLIGLFTVDMTVKK